MVGGKPDNVRASERASCPIRVIILVTKGVTTEPGLKIADICSVHARIDLEGNAGSLHKHRSCDHNPTGCSIIISKSNCSCSRRNIPLPEARPFVFAQKTKRGRRFFSSRFQSTISLGNDVTRQAARVRPF